jgi:hypothetical protein
VLGRPDAARRPLFEHLTKIHDHRSFEWGHIDPATIHRPRLKSGHPILRKQRYEARVCVSCTHDMLTGRTRFDPDCRISESRKICGATGRIAN